VRKLGGHQVGIQTDTDVVADLCRNAQQQTRGLFEGGREIDDTRRKNRLDERATAATDSKQRHVRMYVRAMLSRPSVTGASLVVAEQRTLFTTRHESYLVYRLLVSG